MPCFSVKEVNGGVAGVLIAAPKFDAAKLESHQII
jgi:hypothetical protein